jgi:hypothetical protein
MHYQTDLMTGAESGVFHASDVTSRIGSDGPDEADPLCCYSEMLIVAIVFLVLLFISVPYGCYTSRSWGFLVNAKFLWFAMKSSVTIFHFLFGATRRASGVPIHVFAPVF